ncbi:MAG: SCO family protein [bacterium]
MEKKPLTWKEWSAMGVALAALVVLGVLIVRKQFRPADQILGQAPAFRLEDRSGKMISNTDLKGRYWVADFIFTRCATSCPILSEKMRQLQKIWKGNPKVDFVTFTVDPDYDTVKVLKQYAADLDADPNQWFFLTGKKKTMLSVAEQGFKLSAVENPGAQPGALFMHSVRFVLVDPKGNIRGYYVGTDATEYAKLKRDLKAFLS